MEQDTPNRISKKRIRTPSSELPEFLRGSLSAVVNVTLTFPLSKLISRQAYEGLSVFDAFATMRRERLWHLYRGLAPPLMQQSFKVGVMYSSYDYFSNKLYYAKNGSYNLSGPSNLDWELRVAAGALSGSAEGLLAPFERVQTVLQHRHYNEMYKNSWEAVLKLSQFGVFEFYRGFSAIVLRNAPASATWFALKDPVRDLFRGKEEIGQKNSSKQLMFISDVVCDFLSGGVLGASISTLFYPVNVVKSVMQLDVGSRHRGFLETFSAVYQERGLNGLYYGVAGNAARSLLAWGILNSSKEAFDRVGLFESLITE
jgi:hypothetical protein